MVTLQNLALLSPALLAAARATAERLAEHGYRAWIVGGTVRDLVRGEAPKDVDMASAATPEEVQRLFPRTVAVGKAFGTLIVVWEGVQIELTTYRSEAGYGDARRPNQVRYGKSVEEDAVRRDFTCNALYLDPLNAELLDPTGGQADLARGILRTVGDPALRFAEDGLRLLRMARFEGALDLQPAPGLHEAAQGSLDALRGVSPERVRMELVRIFAKPGSERACRVLLECGILARALPLWAELIQGEARADVLLPLRLAVLRELGSAPLAELGLAVLLEVDPLGPAEETTLERARELCVALRLSRSEQAACFALWRARRRWEELALVNADRASLMRCLKLEYSREALRWAQAWAKVRGIAGGALERLAHWAGAQSAAELAAPALLTADDLLERGLTPGRQFGVLLAEAETQQWNLAWVSRAQALAWLDQRLLELRREMPPN